MPFITQQQFVNNTETLKFRCLLVNYQNDRQRLYTSIYNIADYPIAIDQNDSYLCGAAAFLCCIAFQDISRGTTYYQQYLLNLALYGEAEIGELQIKPSQQCKDSMAPDGIHPVDWIGLAAFKDATNRLMHVTSSSDVFASLTLPCTLAGWFFKTGLFDAPINRTNTLFSKNIHNVIRANNYFNNNREVCLFIHSAMLKNHQAITFIRFYPNHFAVLTSPFLLNNIPVAEHTRQPDENDKITFSVYSWGERINIDLPWHVFKYYYHGYIAC